MRKTLFIITLLVLLIIPSSNPVYARPDASQSYSTEIDDFLTAGAQAYLAWQYSGTPGSEFENDAFSFFRGQQTCQVLKQKGAQYPGKIGVNIHGLGGKDVATITDHLTWVRDNCGTSIVRFWGFDDSASVIKVMQVARSLNLKVIVALIDFGPTLPSPPISGSPTWFASGYKTTYLLHARDVAGAIVSNGLLDTLYAIELSNESHCAGVISCPPVYAAWAADASTVLVSEGIPRSKIGIGQKASENTTRGDSPGAGSPPDFRLSNQATNIGITSGHYYSATEKGIVLQALQISQSLGKPFYVGEAGFNGGSTSGTQVGLGDPRSGEFKDPLMYPCDQTTTNEFHPLRPYPGSPCDPLIPGRPNPDTHNPTQPLSFSCGTSINAGGAFRFPNVRQSTVLTYPLFPADAALADPGVNYRCDNTPTSNVCVVRRVGYDLTLDLSNAELPIVGNTQDPMDDATKANYYLTWYLNGTIQHSDQLEIDPTDPAQIDRLINYSGPLKKLLPYSHIAQIQTDVNFGTAIYDGQSNSGLNRLHRYLVNKPTRLEPFIPGPDLWQELLENIPLSSLEDVTGEVTVSIIGDQQPRPSEPRERNGQLTLLGDDYVIPLEYKYGVLSPTDIQRNQNAIQLRIRPSSDGRLYFPHLRSVNYLSEVLTNMSRPQDLGGIDIGNPELTRQRIDSHQGRPAVIPGGDNSINAQPDNEYFPPRVDVPYTKPFVVTRNTEVFDPVVQKPPVDLTPAPSPAFTDYNNWYSQQDYLPQDQRCTILSSRLSSDNPGDTLFGQKIESKLNYTQVFNYPAYIVPTPAPDQPACTDSDNCATGRCNSCSKSEGDPYPPACPGFTCEWRDGSNQDYCTAATPATVGCGTFVKAEDMSRPTRSRVAVYVKTPLVDQIYDTLVSGKTSFLRHLLPKAPDDIPYAEYDYIAGEVHPDGSRDLTRTRPASSSVAYSGAFNPFETSTTDKFTPDPVTGGAADGGLPTLYFPRLGSLFDYMLGADLDEPKNLQRILRPYQVNSSSLVTPPPQNSCNMSTTAFKDAVMAAIPSVATQYGIPATLLQAIFEIESMPYLTGAVPYACEENAVGAAGPFAITRSTYELVTCAREAYSQDIGVCTSDSTHLSRCDIRDNVELGARVLLFDAGRWLYGPGDGPDDCRATGGIASSEKAVIYRASNNYYGSCNPDSITKSYSYLLPSPKRSDPPGMNYGDIVLNKMGLLPYITPQCQ